MTSSLARLTAALADRYTIERELGVGGMATVYLAEDLKHHRKVAIKVLQKELAVEDGAERFVREVETTAHLRHPHIVPLYDSGVADGFPFYVMPLVEGESLRTRLDREKQLPIEEALSIAREVADALSYAHSHGIVHRDIKPENVLLESGHAVVTDFGIAKALGIGHGQTLTQSGMAIGTPHYMSPEQAAGEGDIDGRSDVYSLGCMLYEMLAGRPPFIGPTTESVVRQHLGAEAPLISQLRPSVPADVVMAIQRAMAKTPADRFNPVVQFAEALRLPTTTLSVTRAPRPWRAMAVTAAVMVVTWFGWRAFRPAPFTISVTNIRQVTREPEAEIHVALSPDGREVAYESGAPGNTHIVVRDVVGGRPLSLTGDWLGVQGNPRWTSDGREVLFENAVATTDHGVGSWKLPRLGGQAIAVDSVDSQVAGAQPHVAVRGDTTIVRAEDGRETIVRVGPRDLHSFAWRRDGKMVAWVRGNRDYVKSWGNVAPSQVWVTLIGGMPFLVSDSTSLNASPAWLPDGSLLFVSNQGGARDIYAVALHPSGAPRGRPLRLTTGMDPFSVSVSADGGTVAYDRLILSRNLFTLPMPGSGVSSIRETRALTTASQVIEMASVSRDGQWLAFDSNLRGQQDLYVMPATGGEPRQVAVGPGDKFNPDFSPDGREIVFHTTRHGTRDIYLIRTDGTGEQRLTSDAAESFHPAFSPNGLVIAYSNLDSTSTTFLMRRTTLDGSWGTPEPLPIPDAFGPRWSPDGRTLVYFTHARPGGVGVYPLDGKPRALVLPGAHGLAYPSWPEWSPDGQSIYFRAIDGTGVEGLYRIPVAGGIPRLVVRFDDPSRSVFLGSVVIANGRFYFSAGQLQSDIFLMDLVRP